LPHLRDGETLSQESLEAFPISNGVNQQLGQKGNGSIYWQDMDTRIDMDIGIEE